MDYKYSEVKDLIKGLDYLRIAKFSNYPDIDTDLALDRIKANPIYQDRACGYDSMDIPWTNKALEIYNRLCKRGNKYG
jgi:hypothetical protein